MKRNPGKTMAKANQAGSVAKSGKPIPALEFSSPPCYAHEFPGYFGEVEGRQFETAAAEETTRVNRP